MSLLEEICNDDIEKAKERIGRLAGDLRWLAKEIREVGDLGVVKLSEDGVTNEPITVADWVWLIALQLDGKMSDES